MLQQVEYDPSKLIGWLAKFPNIFEVSKRGKLILTRASKALLLIVFSSQMLLIVLTLFLFIMEQLFFGMVLLLATPIVLILELIVIMFLGNKLLKAKRAPLMREAEEFFNNHSGKRIAVLGSYGKTSMKELLNTVLGTKLNVAMTPGNKNVAISHARWSKTLSGEEDVLIIEYGEGEPGDIKRLASLSHPNLAVLTGLAPNHLDYYKTIKALQQDFLDIADFVKEEHIYVNNDGNGIVEEFGKNINTYDASGVSGWHVRDIKLSISGTSFEIKKGKDVVHVHSGLLGRHNIGPLCAVVKIALDLGLTFGEVEDAIQKTMPFEHRMQPRQVNGAWIIDDAYNGNLEGFRAGLQLLSELEAKRKIYVTPGLVDQGEETERVHIEIGKAIAKANPDKVVLMKNSVTDIVNNSLQQSGFNGEVEIVDNPLEYYQNLDQFVAAGDLVMLQNDWTDNYN